jgi:NAD(P)-dependent dehydrogenase (short-subunit alcohol dehydrogenase family)
VTATILILGAGTPRGVGGAIALRFAQAGYHIVVTGRTPEKIEVTRAAILANGGTADAMSCDVTSEDELDAVFDTLAAKDMPLASVIYNAGNNSPVAFEALTPEQFEAYWRVCCLGAFLAAKRALPLLAQQGNGSMMFTGASASLRGKPNFAHFSSAKGALRNLAQALAREYGPQGVHVAHLIIDGVVNGDQVRSRFGDYLEKLGEDGALDPTAIAEAFWMVHSQPRSAWTHELDLRPFKEAW